ncbi:hypothetical protein [Enterococcus ratti]|uniref:Uncharacterized protein n=1 Tax=Enterococcus ratti TaxID=150033 RepID=A0A1L8W8M1_9ENTE|nr:hypothetical protein [Enterococcus ratti]OJG77354.1 hypothetical protein RV14_GL001587 [Enterococcus ratti]
MNLVKVKNNQVVTTSLHIAEVFGKQHKGKEYIENKLEELGYTRKEVAE